MDNKKEKSSLELLSYAAHLVMAKTTDNTDNCENGQNSMRMQSIKEPSVRVDKVKYREPAGDANVINMVDEHFARSLHKSPNAESQEDLVTKHFARSLGTKLPP